MTKTTTVRRLDCGALARARYGSVGWECTGRDLTRLMDGPAGIPIVVPTRLVDLVLATHPSAPVMVPVPFEGGDHLHLVVAPEFVSKR